MLVKAKTLSALKPKQLLKQNKAIIQEKVAPYEQANKQMRQLATDNSYFCVYGYN